MSSTSSYIDRFGGIVIDASSYDSAGNFSGGLAPVLVPRQGWGFIDKTGALVIPPKFESTLGFSDGLAAVLLDRMWGFIDKSGVLVIENQYEWVGQFSEGVAVVERPLQPKRSQRRAVVEHWDLLAGNEADNDSEFLVIDTSGQIRANLNQRQLEVDIDDAKFAEGLLCVYSKEKKANGYVDKSWEFVIPPKFATAGSFSEGLARVAVIEDEMEKLGFIDKNGNVVIPPTFNTDFDFRRNSSDFSEGLAAVSEGLNPSRTEMETFVYIDNAGDIVLVTEFFYAGQFHEGLAIVYNAETDRWGFIDKTGKVVIPVQYRAANDFAEGLALVRR